MAFNIFSKFGFKSFCLVKTRNAKISKLFLWKIRWINRLSSYWGNRRNWYYLPFFWNFSLKTRVKYNLASRRLVRLAFSSEQVLATTFKKCTPQILLSFSTKLEPFFLAAHHGIILFHLLQYRYYPRILIPPGSNHFYNPTLGVGLIYNFGHFDLKR